MRRSLRIAEEEEYNETRQNSRPVKELEPDTSLIT